MITATYNNILLLQSAAVLVMLSLGYFNKVIEMLYGMRQFNRAVCFIEAAMEFGLLEKDQKNGKICYGMSQALWEGGLNVSLWYSIPCK